MHKLGAIILIIIFGGAAFLLFNLMAPLIVGFANTANTTVAASSNMSNYPGTSEGLVLSPWLLLLVIPVICVILIIQVLRSPDEYRGY